MSFKRLEDLSETKLIFQQYIDNRFNGSDGEFAWYPTSISFVSNKYCFIIGCHMNDILYIQIFHGDNI